MSNLTISAASSLTGSTVAIGDLIPLLDISASSGSKGSKITVGELFTGRAISGGTATGLTSLGLRSTGAAFDLTLATSEVLSAGRTLSFNVGNADRVLTIPSTGTVAMLGIANAFSVNGAASTPAISGTGSIFSGGSATTTKPYWLIEPTGTTSTGWGTAGTGLGINLPTAFAGRALSVQKEGVEVTYIRHDGRVVASALQSQFIYNASGGFIANIEATFALAVALSVNNNAAVGVAIPSTHTITILDATGTPFKVLCSNV